MKSKPNTDWFFIRLQNLGNNEQDKQGLIRFEEPSHSTKWPWNFLIAGSDFHKENLEKGITVPGSPLADSYSPPFPTMVPKLLEVSGRVFYSNRTNPTNSQEPGWLCNWPLGGQRGILAMHSGHQHLYSTPRAVWWSMDMITRSQIGMTETH